MAKMSGEEHARRQAEIDAWQRNEIVLRMESRDGIPVEQIYRQIEQEVLKKRQALTDLYLRERGVEEGENEV